LLLNASGCDAVSGEHGALCQAQGGGAGLSNRQFEMRKEKRRAKKIDMFQWMRDEERGELLDGTAD
jgi:hypothetical protein